MTVYFLGTGAAVSDPHRTTTMLAVERGAPGTGFVLVDCGGDAVHRLLLAGLDPAAVEAVVLTHQHPDHIGGFALLAEKLWLLGRREPVPVVGPDDALRVARGAFDLYDTARWSGLPARDWRPVPMTPAAPLPGLPGVTAWPVEHPVPTIGLRFEGTDGTVLGYSADTSPCENVVALARGADLLVHEASGHLPGVHASPEEAAAAARDAGARALVLVHMPPGQTDAHLATARDLFPATRWAVEGEHVPLVPSVDVARAALAGEPVR
jgi:ribonuclease Z